MKIIVIDQPTVQTREYILEIDNVIKYFLSHFSVSLRSVHGHRIPHEAPAEMHIDIKRCNTPNFYYTYHTFMTLYCIVLTTCFYEKRAAEDQSTCKI